MEYSPSYVDDLYLSHHGIKGMHWGVRRYENYDGTLTPAGRKKYAKLASKYDKKSSKSLKKAAVKGVVGTAATLAVRKNPYLYKATPYVAGATAASAGASLANGARRKAKHNKYMKAVASNRSPKSGIVSKGLKAAAGAALVGGTAYALHKTGKDKQLIEAATNKIKNSKISDISKKSTKISEPTTHRASDAIKEANAKASKARAAATKQQAASDIFAQQISTIKDGTSKYLNSDNAKKAVNTVKNTAGNAAKSIATAVKEKNEASKKAKEQARYEQRRTRERTTDDTAEQFEKAKTTVSKIKNAPKTVQDVKTVYNAAKSVKTGDISEMIGNLNQSTIEATNNLLNQFGINR